MREPNTELFAIRLLRRFCPAHLYEGIAGDLLEQFEIDQRQGGKFVARLRLIYNMLRFFRPGIIFRNKARLTSSFYDHVKSDLKVSYRSVLKQKFYSIINIIGLTVGLTAAFFIVVFVSGELSYDRHFKDGDQIYRISLMHEGEQVFHSAWTPPTVGLAFQREHPEVEMFTTFRKYWKGFSVQQENYQLPVQSVYLVTPSFLDFFSVGLISGNRSTALNSPDYVLISSRLAQNLFGSEDAVGKSIRTTFGDKIITGVIKPSTRRSHIEPPDVIISLIGFNNKFDVLENWSDDASYYNYIKLDGKSHFDKVKDKLSSAGKRFTERWMKDSQLGNGQFGDGATELQFQKITDIHLHSHKEFEIAPNGSALYVYLFSIVGILLLAIASINYINLATARSSTRVKEIGIRKALGSQRKELIRQFMTESFLITLIAFLLSAVLFVLILPQFNLLIGKSLTLRDLVSPGAMSIMVVILIVMTTSGGFYPAIIMSRYKPVNALNAKVSPGKAILPVRRSLVVMQFASTVVLLVCALTVFLQFKFMSSSDLGFGKDHVLAITIDAPEDRQKLPVLKNIIAGEAGVESVGLTAQLPGGDNLNTEPFMLETGNGDFSERLVQYAFVDSGVIPTLNLRFIQGRNFQEEKYEFGASVIVNETLVTSMGWIEPLGKRVKLPIGREAEVIGVVRDFHAQSFHHEIQPFFLIHIPEWANILLIKFNAPNIPSFVSGIKEKYERIFKGSVMNFTFLDQQFAQQYNEDKNRGKLFAVFSVIAIVVSCVGLFALLGVTISHRTKEIGIRRVVGATAFDILRLLSMDFIKLVAFSFLISIPLAHYAIDSWLQTFSYRIELNWWVYGIPMIVTLVFAMLAMSMQWTRALNLNAIETLRCQ
jgi:putative ABC transport system permease protein